MDTTQLHEAYNSLSVAITHFFQHSIPVWQVLISATVISICQYYLLKLGTLICNHYIFVDTRLDAILFQLTEVYLMILIRVITASFNSFASYLR